MIILGSNVDCATTTEQSVKEKKLRSLNDVLGKKPKNLKVAKNSTGNWVLLNVFIFYYTKAFFIIDYCNFIS